MPAPCKTFHCLTVSEVGSSWYKKHPGRTSRSLGALPPPPPPSPWAVELLAPAAGYLIAGSGEKQRSASRLEALTPSPSRCRHRNHPVRHHMQRYLRPCDITPSDPPAPADCFLQGSPFRNQDTHTATSPEVMCHMSSVQPVHRQSGFVSKPFDAAHCLTAA